MVNNYFLDGERYYGACFSLLDNTRANEGFVPLVFGTIYYRYFGGFCDANQCFLAVDGGPCLASHGGRHLDAFNAGGVAIII